VWGAAPRFYAKVFGQAFFKKLAGFGAEPQGLMQSASQPASLKSYKDGENMLSDINLNLSLEKKEYKAEMRELKVTLGNLQQTLRETEIPVIIVF